MKKFTVQQYIHGQFICKRAKKPRNKLTELYNYKLKCPCTRFHVCANCPSTLSHLLSNSICTLFLFVNRHNILLIEAHSSFNG